MIKKQSSKKKVCFVFFLVKNTFLSNIVFFIYRNYRIAIYNDELKQTNSSKINYAIGREAKAKQDTFFSI